MTIPYDTNHEGINIYGDDQGGDFYVVLDKAEVDKIEAEIWDTFETVRYECAVELRMCLNIKGAIEAISPTGDPTYILNFNSHLSEHSGELQS